MYNNCSYFYDVKGIGIPILCLLSIVSSFAQDSLTDNILTTRKLRRGIYKTLDEFKKNSPSITTEFTIKGDTGRYDRYWLYEKGKKIRNVYGFSDGQDLFISAKVYGQPNYFVQVLLVGEIIYFEDKRGKSNIIGTRHAVAWGALGGVVAGVIAGEIAAANAEYNPGWIIYLGEDDGFAYILDKKSLDSIFKEADQDLYNRYKKEKDRQDFKVLLKYVVEFNERVKIYK